MLEHITECQVEADVLDELDVIDGMLVDEDDELDEIDTHTTVLLSLDDEEIEYADIEYDDLERCLQIVLADGVDGIEQIDDQQITMVEDEVEQRREVIEVDVDAKELLSYVIS